MRYFSSFTGVGGFDLAAPKDWECVGFSEIDKYANMVLRYQFPDVKNYGDVNAIKWEEIPDFEVLFGGTPCQDLSLAGKRKGLAGERSGLLFKFVEALKAKKPKYFIWENVKGALSSNQGWDFAEVLNQFSEAGYSLWWQLLNAKHFGVPQNRERIFIVGFRDRSPPEVFFEPEDGIKNNEEGAVVRTFTAGGHSGGLHSNSTAIIVESGDTRMHTGRGIGIAPTLYYHAPIAYNVFMPKTNLYAVQAVLTPDREKKRQQGRRFKNPGEPMFTLTGQDIHGVSFTRFINSNMVVPTLKATKDRGSAYTPLLVGPSKIRRLTPRECERLMSWPDDWTRWGIDEKGNTIEISDTQRYKMAGNGVVSNVVKWLIENIILRD